MFVCHSLLPDLNRIDPNLRGPQMSDEEEAFTFMKAGEVTLISLFTAATCTAQPLVNA